LKTLLIHPGQSIIETILPHLKCAGKDYSSSMVVFPGRRPAHFLRKALARELQTSFIPPTIFSMDDFVDFVSGQAQSKKNIETIDAVTILYDIHKKAVNPIGTDRFMTPDSFFPIGLKIYRDIEELSIEGIHTNLIKSIQTYIDEHVPEHATERLQSLSYFYEEFYKFLEQQQFTTRALKYRIASRTVDKAGLDTFQLIIFAGFFALTRHEQTMFKKLLSYDNSLFIFQSGPGMEEKLKTLGINIEREQFSAPETQFHFYQSPDTHGQVYALSTIIASKIDRDKHLNERSTIVLPTSETLFPLLRQGLPLLSEKDYNVSLGYPLLRTPIFGFLNNLMDLITSMDEDLVYIPDYLKFVLHPYTKNIYFNGDAEITRIIFHALEEVLLRNRERTFLTLSEIEEDEQVLTHVMKSIPHDRTGVTDAHIKNHLQSIHHNTIERFISFDSVKDFALKCTDVLTYICNKSTARLHPLFYPFSESFMRSLDVLSKSLMKTVVFAERNSYFLFFRKYIMTCHTPFEGTPVSGLQILGFLETRNLSFDTVFFLDVNEETIPATKKEDTLLPHKARQILGLPTYQDRDKLTAYYFYTLIHGARDVHLFYCENDAKEKSRFVEHLLWEKQKRDGTTDARKYLNFIQYKVNLEQSQPQDIIKTDGIMEYLQGCTYSATSLDTYLKCPLQFYYSFVLRLDKKDELSGEIERVDIGKLVHRILSEYFSRRSGTPLHENDLNPLEMEHLVKKHFEQSYGKHVTGTAFLLKKQIEHHLKDLLKSYYVPLVREESVTVLRTECDIIYRTGPFTLKGRLDSIERRGTKTYIIDFKTSANPNFLRINYKNLDFQKRESWGDAIGSLQLPLYLLLYSQQTGTSISDLNGMFLFIGKTRISRDIEFSLFDNRVHAESTYSLLCDIIFRILDEITDPSIPFTPTENKRACCPSCNFQYVCGTQWIMKR
jgi:ATP-dependent helicase/nuclease subunit B